MIRGEMIASMLKAGDQQNSLDPLAIIPKPDIEKLERGGVAAVDLRLGTWFVSLRQARMPILKYDDINPKSRLTKTQYVPLGDEFYLHPKAFVLAITLEWIRLPKSIGAYVIGRSSWGRRGLVIATATGVHPGFTGCLTLELSNLGEIPISLSPGMTICQLFFHRVEGEASTNPDSSQFSGSRKPALGDTGLDDYAKRIIGRRPEK